MTLSICMCPTVCRTNRMQCCKGGGGGLWWTKHPVHGLYLFSRDFHLFWSLKNALKGCMLLSDSNVQDVVQWCRQQPKELFAHGIYGLVHQMDSDYLVTLCDCCTNITCECLQTSFNSTCFIKNMYSPLQTVYNILFIYLQLSPSGEKRDFFVGHVKWCPSIHVWRYSLFWAVASFKKYLYCIMVSSFRVDKILVLNGTYD
jgi:hypothetical protein